MTRHITLSRKQIGEADRVGGIELLILWPPDLGPEPAMELDSEDEAKPAEKARAEQLVGESCRQHDLVPVHTRVACVHRPYGLPVAGGATRVHLAVTIIGRRWVHARMEDGYRGQVMFAAEPT